jgi:hypothetical protein
VAIMKPIAMMLWVIEGPGLFLGVEGSNSS